MQSKITFTDSVVLPEGNVYVLTDENVARLYPFVTGRRGFVIEPGEDAKTLPSVGRIARDMLEKGCDRGTTFVTVGGGVVGDLGGFVAATYMRGLKWINVPTTLLAQVDSSVGGKTAVDLDGYKNIVGAFWLPEEVIVSPMWLDTLPPREKLCGEGEIFKTSLIDAGVYGMYEPGHITPELIRACIRFKEGVVRDDFRETGRRKILNAGHTLGHALEKEDNHALSHGEYVIMGLALESFLFRDKIRPAFYEHIRSVADRLAPVIPFSPAAVAAAALSDKKNAGGLVSVIVTQDAGVCVEEKVTAERIIEGLSAWK